MPAVTGPFSASGTSAIILFALLLELAGLIFIVLADPYIQRPHKIIMIIISLCVLSLIIQNYIGFRLDIEGGRPLAHTLESLFGYCMRPVILLLYFYIIKSKQDYWRAWTLVIINTVIHLSALFSPIVFSFSESGAFHRGPMGYTCHIISVLLLIQLLYLSAKEYDRSGGIERYIPLFNTLLIIAGIVIDSTTGGEDLPVTYLTVAVASSCMFFYIWMHLQFVRRHEMSLRAEQRIQIMISQIQPHFLFNTLSTIQALCLTDSDKAADTVGKLGAYLRQNLDSLNQAETIPFEKELEHVQLYTAIEMIRFPSIQVDFRIEDDDFKIPALSIQPLVENSIRHGVRARGEGRVTVRSWRDLDAHVITITDNGVGFDVEAAKHAEGTHIGIRNVTERIEKMCGGTVEINSKEGEGTSVTIRIPVKGGQA